MVTNWPLLKSRVSTIADQFGPAALDLTLADVLPDWAPQTPFAPTDDADTARQRLAGGKAAPVVSNGRVVGVLANSTRGGIGSSSVTGLYGPRFAVFADQKANANPPTRTCPTCGRIIDFYKMRRVTGGFERRCPFCDCLIPREQP